MVIEVEELFVFQLKKCPASFQQKFKKVYQQLKVVDSPLEVKHISSITGNKNYYKLTIEESRIGMLVKAGKLYILCFLYNQYFE